MKSLQKITIALILILTIVGSSSFQAVSVSFSRKGVQSTYESDMLGMAYATASEIQTDVQRYYDVMTQIGRLKTFSNPKISLDVKQDELDSISAADKTLIGINYLDDKGNCRVTGAGLINFAESPFWQVPMQGQDIVLGPAINMVTNEMTMYYASPVKDTTGNVIGTMLIASNGDVLCNVCDKVKFGETGSTVIIDRNSGVLAGSKDRKLVMEGYNYLELAESNPDLKDFGDLVKKMMEGEAGGGYYVMDGKKKFMTFAPVEGTFWSVAITVEWDEYDAKLEVLRRLAGITSILMILIGLAIAIYVGRSLKPLRELGDAINDIGTGNADLTRRLDIKHTKAEIAYVVEGFNKFVEKLQSIMKTIKESERKISEVNVKLLESTENTSTSIRQIIGNINNVSTQIEEQSGSIGETASAMNEISANMMSFERMLNIQSEGVETSSSTVEEMVGNINSVNKSVEKMVKAFKDLEHNAEIGIKTQAEVNEKVKKIDEQSKMLQDANSAIANIAEQTNLLAMNAAIEAAHAGEAGKGFSVVADEIRKLSETSSAQSRTIGDELKKIMDSINNVVSSSMNAASAFETVSVSIKSTDQILQQIRGAMEEQQSGSKQIIDSLHSMNDSTSEVKKASEEMQVGNKHISIEIENLQNSAESMNSAIAEMSSGAERISNSGTTLNSITQELSESIGQISNEIGQFKV